MSTETNHIINIISTQGAQKAQSDMKAIGASAISTDAHIKRLQATLKTPLDVRTFSDNPLRQTIFKQTTKDIIQTNLIDPFKQMMPKVRSAQQDMYQALFSPLTAGNGSGISSVGIQNIIDSRIISPYKKSIGIARNAQQDMYQALFSPLTARQGIGISSMGIQTAIEANITKTMKRMSSDMRKSTQLMYNDLFNAVPKGADKTSQAIHGISQSAKSTNASVEILRATLRNLAVGAIVFQMTDWIDTMTRITNKVKLVTDSQESFNSVMRDVQKVAYDTRSDLEGTATLYQRLALAAEKLGLNQSNLSQVTKTVNQTLQISGATAMEARASMIQLSQGIASGQLRGEEFRSVTETNIRLTKLLKDAITGGDLGKLRTMAFAGELTSEKVIQAILQNALTVQDEYSKMNQTIGQSMIKFKNGVINAFGSMNEFFNITKKLATILEFLADHIGLVVTGLVLMSSASILTGIAALTSKMYIFNVMAKSTQITGIKDIIIFLAGPKMAIAIANIKLFTLAMLTNPVFVTGAAIAASIGLVVMALNALNKENLAYLALPTDKLNKSGQATQEIQKLKEQLDSIRARSLFTAQYADEIIKLQDKIRALQKVADTGIDLDGLLGLSSYQILQNQSAWANMTQSWKDNYKQFLDDIKLFGNAEAKNINLFNPNFVFQTGMNFDKSGKVQIDAQSQIRKITEDFYSNPTNVMAGTGVVLNTKGLQEMMDVIDKLSNNSMPDLYDAQGNLTFSGMEWFAMNTKNFEILSDFKGRITDIANIDPRISKMMDKWNSDWKQWQQTGKYSTEQLLDMANIFAFLNQQLFETGKALDYTDLKFRDLTKGISKIAYPEDYIMREAVYVKTPNLDTSFLDELKGGVILAFKDIGDSYSDMVDDLQGYTVNLFETFGDTIADNLVASITDGKDTWKEFAHQMSMDLLKLMTKMIMFRSLSFMLGLGATQTAWSGEQGFGGFMSFNPFRAGGGDVKSNNPYIVGEKGAELFIPNTSGTIVSNDKLGGMASSPIINNYIVLDSELPSIMANSNANKKAIGNYIATNSKQVKQSLGM